MIRIRIFTSFLLLIIVLGVVTSHLIELKQRVISPEEKRQTLELLQLEVGPETEVPNIKLNSKFFGALKVGDHDQDFEVVFDTGSDALWVYSDSCQICKSAHKHVFDRKLSSTYHKKDNPFSIRYGTGASYGTTGIDKMKFGSLEIQAQPFGQCDEPDEVMKSFPFDGIVGLSRPMFMDPNGLVPVMETIKSSSLLQKQNLANTFSFYLGPEDNDKSYLILGGSHHLLHEGILHWVPSLSKNIFWELPLDDILIHKKEGTVSISHKELTLERHLRSHVLKDEYAQIMTDPFADAPVAEEVSINTDIENIQENEVDPFMSVAEPILLELESDVSMDSTLNRKRKSKSQSHAHAHHNIKKLNDLELGGKDKYQSQTQKNNASTISRAILPKLKHVVPKEKVASNPFDIRAYFSSLSHKENPSSSNENKINSKSEVKLTTSSQPIPRTTTTTTSSKSSKSNTLIESKTKSDSKTETEKTKTTETRGNGELLSDYPISGVSINPCQQDDSHPCIASVDSGHSLISGPPELIRALKLETMPKGGCSEQETANLPDVSFVIGGKLFTLTPMDYLIELEGKCVPAFRERPFRNGHDWVLGEHFMRSFYTVFDYDDMRVGLSRVDKIKSHLETILTPSEPTNIKTK